MNRPIEDARPLDVAVELADDDVARGYEELSETDDPGALLEVAGELALVRDELEELAALEVRRDYASTRSAEAETTDDRVARRLEGMDDPLDALARSNEEAGSRALPDDDVERSVELMGG